MATRAVKKRRASEIDWTGVKRASRYETGYRYDVTVDWSFWFIWEKHQKQQTISNNWTNCSYQQMVSVVEGLLEWVTYVSASTSGTEQE